ncbi:tetraspanin-6 [Pyxicephalus adspersus]|uniref:tetraspanin-6 n=1 Tax=Pyxicephalus adspersus TaxID=30357 RepID=UPI003B5C09F2
MFAQMQYVNEESNNLVTWIALILSFILLYPQITGVILLTVGVWGKVSLEVYFSLLNENATNVPYVLIGTGAVIILLGTFGCFATCRASTWMLKLYAMFLSLIFLIELIAAIVGLVFRHEIRSSFENGYMQALNQYNSTEDEQSRAVDTIQRTGCISSVTNIMESRMGVVAGISFGIACFQLVGMFLACCLSRYITNNQYEMV